MTITLLLGSLLLAQSGPATLLGGQETEQREVAYEQMIAGEATSAIAALERARVDDPSDPALLINLGSAYTQVGDLDRAEEAYRAAAESDERYRLELADGQWVDSRRAAVLALQALEERKLAMR